MLEVDGLAALLVLGLWIYAVIDVISTDESLVRNLPKTMWIILVIMLFDLGAIVWLIAGRPKTAGWVPGSTRYRAPTTFDPNPRRRPVGLEDQPGYGGGSVGSGGDTTPTSGWSAIAREREEAARLKVWEAQLKRREEEIKRREGGVQPDP